MEWEMERRVRLPLSTMSYAEYCEKLLKVNYNNFVLTILNIQTLKYSFVLHSLIFLC